MARKGKILVSIVTKKNFVPTAAKLVSNSQLVVSRVSQSRKHAKRVGAGALVFLAAVLKYLVAEVNFATFLF